MTFRMLRLCLIAGLVAALDGGGAGAQVASDHVQDLSLLVARDLPCVWPVGMTPLAIVPTHTSAFGPYHRDLLVIDEHTGTQWDAPAHFVPPPDSGLPGAGPNGLITGEKVPAWQFCGEACVIDVTAHRDAAAPGASFLIRPEHVRAWEEQHRPLRFGDVVLFRSDYTDRYYQHFPAGDRFVSTALRKETPGWPAPAPETMAYLADKGVMTLGLDSASMGPLPDLAVATHQAGGKRGLIWTECATNLQSLPASGAFVAMLAAKHAGGSGGECRLIGVTEPKLAARLIASARARKVADLSVTLDEDLPCVWPGWAPGEEAGRYVAKTLNAFSAARGPYFARTHLFDSFAGTHVVLPSFSLPKDQAEAARAPADVQARAADFEKKYGPRGTSGLTTERAPLAQMMGEAYVIDVRKLLEQPPAAEPSSPLITLAHVREQEARGRAIRPGDVVIFFSGYTDQHYRPLPAAPEVDRLLAAPLAGKATAWPAPTAEVVTYLADKGVRCLGTDGPTLGGANRRHALEIDWLAASKGLFVVEFLTNVAAIHDRPAFFLFAPIKIEGARGGYGRALALY